VRKPKLRELKEALRAAFSPRYTTHYPVGGHTPPDGFRGKPVYDSDHCIGCGACAEVCPAVAIRVVDRLDGEKPTRTIQQRWDKCIFCGQCELHCTTGDGIKLTKEYDLATLDRSSCVQSIEHELVVCEVCGAAVGTKKHLQWVARRLGAKAYANATLILSGDGWRQLAPAPAPRTDEPPLARNDLMRVQCAACRRTTVIRELWGE